MENRASADQEQSEKSVTKLRAKQHQLLHDLLFQRVYAVRVRGFASNYGRAEVDMHFSISNDLTSLDEMLELLRDHGLQGLTARLERGEL